MKLIHILSFALANAEQLIPYDTYNAQIVTDTEPLTATSKKGVDISTALTQDSANCLHQNGWDWISPRAYRGSG